MRCRHHDLELHTDVEFLEHVLNEHIHILEELMTEMSDDQKHLDDDVQKLSDAWAFELAALKAQVAAQPTVMAAHLDFSKLDALAGVEQAETTVTPAQVPSNDPSLDSAMAPAPVVIGATNVSPFVDPDGDGDTAPEDESVDDHDADDAVPAPAGNNPATSVPGADVSPSSPDVVPDPSTQSTPDSQKADQGQEAGVAAQAPGQTAASVTAPDAELTPSTENPPSGPSSSLI